MDNPKVAAFLVANMEFIRKHGQELAEGIQNSQLGTPEVKNVGLDEDLKVSFNNVAGSPFGQLIILQLQTVRHLGKIVKYMEEFDLVTEDEEE